MKGEYIEQTFYLLAGLHKIARNYELVFDKSLYERTYTNALADPNFFPIITRASTANYVTIWKEYATEINPMLLDKVGFRLPIRKSEIPHTDAGNGVFLESKRAVPAGTLLGFVPGMLYGMREAGKKMEQEWSETGELPFILAFNGDLICYKDKVTYPPFNFGYSYTEWVREVSNTGADDPFEVYPYMLNPYAVGHMINHPPAGSLANVCFLDIPVPQNFFPPFLLRYFPYMQFSPEEGKIAEFKKAYHIMAVVALSTIEPGEELLVNYGEDRFSGGYRPEWLVQPADVPHGHYLTKKESLYAYSKMSNSLLKFYEYAGTAEDSIKQEQAKAELNTTTKDVEMFSKHSK